MCTGLARVACKVTYVCGCASLSVASDDNCDSITLQDARLPALRRQTWEAFERLHAEGHVRALGVSNYLPHHLEELCAPGLGDWVKVKPEVNQFELHPMLQQRDIVDSCARYGISVEAYSSLGQVRECRDKGEQITSNRRTFTGNIGSTGSRHCCCRCCRALAHICSSAAAMGDSARLDSAPKVSNAVTHRRKCAGLWLVAKQR